MKINSAGREYSHFKVDKVYLSCTRQTSISLKLHSQCFELVGTL